MATVQPTINDRREIFGWAMYDWANSAFSTTIGSVFLGPYVRGLATAVAEAEYLARTGTAWTAASGQPLVVYFLGLPVAPEAVIAFAISLSVVFQAGFLPILGAIADYSHRRKQMLQIFATIGAVATISMFFITLETWTLGPLLFIIANLSFGAALVFYNAYLPDIASEEERDRVSSYGFALGYIGGFVLLALNLVLYLLHESFGISESMSVRINLASAGVWWLAFSTVTWRRLRSRHAAHEIPPGENLLTVAFKQLSKTMEIPARSVAFYLLSPLLILIWAPLITPFITQLISSGQLDADLAILPVFVPLFGPVILLIRFLRNKYRTTPETSKFLTSYLIYNDGIQTVIAVAAVFADAPLIRGGLELGQTTLISVILLIQFVAFFGALFWGKLAKWIGAKRAIIVSLVIWAAVVIYAYGGMKGDSRATEFMILGAVIALVLGGSQAISRSLFAQMIPKNKEAEFFSIYEISERGTSWLGTLVFGVAVTIFGNLRIAILALIFFFVVGLAILPFVNTDKAIEDAKRDSAH
ncbi:MAG TPA: MFS transporter [Anaerolineales bacterium]|nr:MFS transporter [Anaerolineales bacterium]HMS00987.1 MFS transporter [Anaerolineales bacterium]HNQ95566.1 MFS transporter [Anaerolineales bacterium]HNS60724.1 MFS transporter [Anaerolineales bacterium]